MGKIKSAITVVCDAGPAIHLDELGCLDLLVYTKSEWNELIEIDSSFLREILQKGKMLL